MPNNGHHLNFTAHLIGSHNYLYFNQNVAEMCSHSMRFKYVGENGEGTHLIRRRSATSQVEEQKQNTAKLVT